MREPGACADSRVRPPPPACSFARPPASPPLRPPVRREAASNSPNAQSMTQRHPRPDAEAQSLVARSSAQRAPGAKLAETPRRKLSTRSNLAGPSFAFVVTLSCANHARDGAESCPCEAGSGKASANRQRGNSNPCGQSPMDFESISLAARTQCHWRARRHDTSQALIRTAGGLS